MSIPFWIVNLSQARLDAMEARWRSSLTQTQLSNPWQQVLLDDKPLPGLWNFEEIERKLTAQANKKSGGDGGPATIRGLLNPDFRLTGELYVPSHFSAWIEVAKNLDVVGKPEDRKQHLIGHPLASLTGVRNVIVLSFRYRAPRGGGPLVVQLGCLGVSERPGATKRPAAPPPPSPVPSVKLPSSGDARTIAPFVIRPPGAAR